MKDYRDAEAAWQRARDLAAEGDALSAAELVIEVAAFYERGRFLMRMRAASEAFDRIVPELDDGLRGARSVWAVRTRRFSCDGRWIDLKNRLDLI